jgi:hypothetical protein
VVACAGKLITVPRVTAVAMPIVVPRKSEKGFKEQERTGRVVILAITPTVPAKTTPTPERDLKVVLVFISNF